MFGRILCLLGLHKIKTWPLAACVAYGVMPPGVLGSPWSCRRCGKRNRWRALVPGSLSERLRKGDAFMGSI